MKTLTIIGNQININNNYSDFINNSDYVIRFNKIDNFNKNTGTKIDELVCRYANGLQIIHGFDENCNYINNKIKLDKINLTIVVNNFNDTKALILANNICKKNKILNFNVIYNNLNNSYKGLADTILSSTGKIMIEFILKKKLYLNYKIYILGFNWFNSCKNNGHMWELEKIQILEYIKNNILTQKP